jgi:hypothetical protein
LPKLWAGIVLGIDGNPPLYLTVAWLIIQPLPGLVSAVAVLKLVNLAFAGAAVIALCRVARRTVSSGACWIGAVLFVTLNDGFIYAASELRTYAIYMLMAAAAMLFQLRLIERGGRGDVALAALAYVGLTLSHTFGIVYVGCIAAAGWLSLPRSEKPLLRLTAIAVAPAVVALIAWTPFLQQQVQVAKPYNWMVSPNLASLLDAMFASDVTMLISAIELCCLLGSAIANRETTSAWLNGVIPNRQGQPVRFVILTLLGFIGFVLAAWLFSQVQFPLFVPRFFTPQLIAAFALHAAFSEWLIRVARHQRAVALALCAIIAPMIMRNGIIYAHNSIHGKSICADPNDRYFESSFVDGDLPVIVDSPHIFLPRSTYANNHDAYRFPLDWDVVLKYPKLSPGNAVDYHLMQGLQVWKPMPQVEFTDDILRKYPQFLVIDIPVRSWFRNLMATHKVVAERLTETSDESACALWKVTSILPLD